MLYCLFVFPNRFSIYLCLDFAWSLSSYFSFFSFFGFLFSSLAFIVVIMCVLHHNHCISNITVFLCRSDLLTPIFKVRLWYLSKIAISHNYHFYNRLNIGCDNIRFIHVKWMELNFRQTLRKPFSFTRFFFKFNFHSRLKLHQ